MGNGKAYYAPCSYDGEGAYTELIRELSNVRDGLKEIAVSLFIGDVETAKNDVIGLLRKLNDRVSSGECRYT